MFFSTYSENEGGYQQQVIVESGRSSRLCDRRTGIPKQVVFFSALVQYLAGIKGC
jgi:hypothetical protein